MLTQRQFLKNLHYIKKKINKHLNPRLCRVFYLYKSSINWFLQSIQNLANELLLFIPLGYVFMHWMNYFRATNRVLKLSLIHI